MDIKTVNIEPKYIKNQKNDVILKEIKDAKSVAEMPIDCSIFDKGVGSKILIPYLDNSKINMAKLKMLAIPNFHIINESCVRGESLSSKKNRKYLYPLKKSGIETVIDLRDKDASGDYPMLCDKMGLKYYHIPIDSNSIDDRKIIENLPLLFDVLSKGKLYIACAQGLHRTDIALALNFFLNPNKGKIPVMYGHFREKGFKYDDISRRLNSIKSALTDNDIKQLGWDKVAFDVEVKQRKKDFVALNSELTKLHNAAN